LAKRKIAIGKSLRLIRFHLIGFMAASFLTSLILPFCVSKMLANDSSEVLGKDSLKKGLSIGELYASDRP
jgi:hypothetical protein